jgi:hypothetical protein
MADAFQDFAALLLQQYQIAVPPHNFQNELETQSAAVNIFFHQLEGQKARLSVQSSLLTAVASQQRRKHKWAGSLAASPYPDREIS